MDVEYKLFMDISDGHYPSEVLCELRVKWPYVCPEEKLDLLQIMHQVEKEI